MRLAALITTTSLVFQTMASDPESVYATVSFARTGVSKDSFYRAKNFITEGGGEITQEYSLFK